MTAMEPHIQYAKTEDGVDIAYSVFGEGEPWVYASNVGGDVHWYVHDDASRATTDGLAAAGWQVICYDGRGMGSSDHRVTDFSLEARVLDLEAVIKKLDLERFVLCGYSQGGPPSIAYCIRPPKRVSHPDRQRGV